MAEFFRFLMEANLITAAFVIGALAFIIAIIGKVKTIIEPSPAMRLLLALFGLFLMALSGIGYLVNPQAQPEREPTQDPKHVSSVPYARTEELMSIAPTSPDEAAALFGGRTELWKPCPDEPSGCWTFSHRGEGYRISVPSACLNPNGSIEGWRYGGEYPKEPDVIDGDFYIWENLEGATIRCY